MCIAGCCVYILYYVGSVYATDLSNMEDLTRYYDKRPNTNNRQHNETKT